MDDDDEREVLIDLLERFHFLDSAQLSNSLANISHHIAVTRALSPKTTRICSKHIGDGPDSSEAVLQFLKPAFSTYGHLGWKTSNFSTNVRNCIQNRDITHIYVVDDFSGTGNQLHDFCEWFAGKAKEAGREDITLCAAFVGMMNTAAQRQYPSILSDLYMAHAYNRSISDDCLEPTRTRYINAMKRIEKRYNYPVEYQFGYGASETIYYCENLSVPNNVFPIFWMRKGSPSSPVFPRL